MDELYKKTFMSWDVIENHDTGKKIRAIALCDGSSKDAWFCAAINTMRDKNTVDKDKHGVYSQIWFADQIGDVECLHFANIKEVIIGQ